MKQVAELTEKVRGLEGRLKISSQQLKSAKSQVDVLTKENAELKNKKQHATPERKPASHLTQSANSGSMAVEVSRCPTCLN
jgi:hypothetical protein